MIIYFANRQMEIMGHASTSLMGGYTITDDIKSEDVETGISTFECKVAFEEETRLELQAMTEAGNYILRSHNGENEFYTIIDTEIDTRDQDIHIYAEDAGLDLINEIVGEYTATEAHTAEWYVEKFSKDSGFVIGLNEIPETRTRKLSWEGESTATERLASVATQFGGFEISYSFDIENLIITNKYINIHEERGKDISEELRLNRDIGRIITKSTVANIATALKCTGGTPKDSTKAITLSGYEYDDGDFYVSGTYLKSRNALEKWSRYQWEHNKVSGYEGHIVKQFSYDTTSQKTLCSQAVAELKKCCDIEVNYDVTILDLRDAKIGDRINIVDDAGELYLSSRILYLESSVTRQECFATLGEHKIKSSGINQQVIDLAEQFSQIAKARTFYTWIAYADDENGTNISLDPTGKAYMGTSANNLEETVDITDPTVFTWVKVVGEGEEGKSAFEVATDNGFKGTEEEWLESLEGEQGTSITKVATQFYLSTSKTGQTGGSWVNEMPSWKSGTYLWTRSVITYSDGKVEYTSPICDSSWEVAKEAEKIATNYMSFKGKYGEGLVIGDFTASALGRNVHITSDGIDLRYGTDNVLASFKEADIYLGNESNQATLHLCGDLGTIGAASDRMQGSILNMLSNNVQMQGYKSSRLYAIPYEDVDGEDRSTDAGYALITARASYTAAATPYRIVTSEMMAKSNNTQETAWVRCYTTDKSSGSNTFVEIGVEDTSSLYAVIVNKEGLFVNGIKTVGNGVFHSNGTLVCSAYLADNTYFLRPASDGGASLGTTTTRWNGVNANILRTYDESTTSNGVAARIYNNRIYRYSSSSKRYKSDIEPITVDSISPEKLYEVEVVQFKYNPGYLIDEDKRCDALIPGFIVEDLEKVYPIAVDYNDDGTPEMWNANIMIPPMLKLIQELHKEVEALKERIS